MNEREIISVFLSVSDKSDHNPNKLRLSFSSVAFLEFNSLSFIYFILCLIELTQY